MLTLKSWRPALYFMKFRELRAVTTRVPTAVRMLNSYFSPSLHKRITGNLTIKMFNIQAYHEIYQTLATDVVMRTMCAAINADLTRPSVALNPT